MKRRSSSTILDSPFAALLWLFFRPSAWRAYVTRIDPELPSDFCLFDLRREHWSTPALRRMLRISFGFYPLLLGLSVALVQLLLGRSLRAVVCGGLETWLRSITGSMAIAVGVSLAAGITSAAMSGVVIGMFYVVWNRTGTADELLLTVAVGITFSVVLRVVNASAGGKWLRRVGNVFLGSLVGCVTLALVNLAATGLAIGIPANFQAYVLAQGSEVPFTLLAALLGGLLLGSTLGWRAHQWRKGLRLGVVMGLLLALMTALPYAGLERIERKGESDIVYAVLNGLQRGLWYGVRNGAYAPFPYMLADMLGGPVAGAAAGLLSYVSLETVRYMAYENAPFIPTVIYFVLSAAIGMTFTWWRPAICYPFQQLWHRRLYRRARRRPDRAAQLLRKHAAFWDEYQWLPLRGLEVHLVLVMEHDPLAGATALADLARGRQRWAAQATQLEWDARVLERCVTVDDISRVHRGLGDGLSVTSAESALSCFHRISRDVEAALHYTLMQRRRLVLRQCSMTLKTLEQDLATGDMQQATRFVAIAARWRALLHKYLQQLNVAVEERQETENPYVSHLPLTRGDTSFVPRGAAVAALNRWLAAGAGPLLLYGQRRTGKTSLLNHLGQVLPDTVLPLLVDLQGPVTRAADYAGFLYNVARAMANAAQQHNVNLPALPYSELLHHPQARFEAWLGNALTTVDATFLLALDEFEALDTALNAGRYLEEHILETLQSWLRLAPRLRVLLAGSHRLDEFPRWRSSMPGVTMLHLSYLTTAEARQVLTQPAPDFALQYTPEAITRVLALTCGHPALVQWLGAEIIALKGTQLPAYRRQITQADVEAAATHGLQQGNFFFTHIEDHQITTAGRAVLRQLAEQGEGATLSEADLAVCCAANLVDTLALLLRRELIEPAGGGYRFQVELIRRWFAETGNSKLDRALSFKCPTQEKNNVVY